MCVHSPEDECCVQQPLFETLTHQNVNDEKNCYVILEGHVCVCVSIVSERDRRYNRYLFYAYQPRDFHFQNMTDETRPVSCITYSTNVYVSECDSRHKCFFCLCLTDGCVCSFLVFGLDMNCCVVSAGMCSFSEWTKFFNYLIGKYTILYFFFLMIEKWLNGNGIWVLGIHSESELIKSNYRSLKVCHPRCVRSIVQSCSMCIYLYIHTVMNTTILQLVAIYNIQLEISSPFQNYHTYCIVT